MAEQGILAIGLTGTIASGKEEVASVFIDAGYQYFSLSDRVKEEAARRSYDPPSRADLQAVGNEMRRTHGPAVWAQRTLEKIQTAGVARAVVDGFRNPHEVRHFREHTDFYLIAVDAPVEIRYRRLAERRRPGDPASLEDFLRLDARDRGVGEGEEGQQVGACLKLAQATISNEGNLQDLKRRAEDLLKQLARSR